MYTLFPQMIYLYKDPKGDNVLKSSSQINTQVNASLGSAFMQQVHSPLSPHLAHESEQITKQNLSCDELAFKDSIMEKNGIAMDYQGPQDSADSTNM